MSMIAVQAALALAAAQGAGIEAFRPPAAPLAVVDPYFSVWSMADRLHDTWPQHWTGANHGMSGMIRIDGKTYRFMGPEGVCPDAIPQQSLRVYPTRTEYVFATEEIELCVTFMTPMLPDDFALMSAPLTFLFHTVRSLDGKQHAVSLYFDASAEWAVDEAAQEVAWERAPQPVAGLRLIRFGTTEQPVLQKHGDNRRIDWGYFYVGAPDAPSVSMAVEGAGGARTRFRESGTVAADDDSRMPRAAQDDWPVIACVQDVGQVDETPAEAHVVLAYDDLYAIEYMHTPLRPWWFRAYGSFDAMLNAVIPQYDAIRARCAAFDESLLADARRIGGEEYARLIGVTYRHVLGSGKTVEGPDKAPWFFHKECFSNGCIATVDVSYPASPFFALFAPELLAGMMRPIFDYADSGQWPHPFAPHDVGTYPKANGQVYNGTKLEGQMPVEECGNMILMCGALARATGNADFAQANWKLISQWAAYLEEQGFDPKEQLCTDDFTGHLARNTNLSLKAINALGAYSILCGMVGKTAEQAKYAALAKEMAGRWVDMAAESDHFRLTFDPGDTWSLKYNLVWDKLLGLELFPPEVAAKEVAYYLQKRNTYGTPLDNRADFTKTDWLVWCATLASTPEDFSGLLNPIYRFMHETPDRVPLTDWYDTKTGVHIHFRARPTIGGVYIPFLALPDLWSAWAGKAGKSSGG